MDIILFVSNKSFRNTIRVADSLDPVQARTTVYKCYQQTTKVNSFNYSERISQSSLQKRHVEIQFYFISFSRIIILGILLKRRDDFENISSYFIKKIAVCSFLKLVLRGNC